MSKLEIIHPCGTKKLTDLEVGEVFKWECGLFMKVISMFLPCGELANAALYAVDLKTGTIILFDAAANVQPVKAKLYIS